MSEYSSELVIRLLSKFPELRHDYEQSLDIWDDEEPGPHVVYGDLFTPFILHLLEDPEKNDKVLKRAFDFLEELALSEDIRVREVVSVTVCERLTDVRPAYMNAWTLMGPATKRLCREVDEYWGTINSDEP